MAGTPRSRSATPRSPSERRTWKTCRTRRRGPIPAARSRARRRPARRDSSGSSCRGRSSTDGDPPRPRERIMSGLTPAERRGARVLAILLAIGTLHDLGEARHPRPLPPPEATLSARAASIPTAVAPPAPGTPPANAGSGPGVAPLNLDTATAAELDRLPGIGPVLAARIVEQRRLHGPFRRVDDLLSVPGIGSRLLARLRPWLREPG